jgi:hypothetical protein
MHYLGYDGKATQDGLSLFNIKKAGILKSTTIEFVLYQEF